jgi:OOP family OmpA-OmpF porin
MRLARLVLTSVIAFGALAGVPAKAQSTGASGLAALEDDDALVSELSMRYEAALAKSLDGSVTAAKDSRHIWAIEAKVQCAIALGYMKSSTRDAPSIGKCAQAYDLMNRVPAPVVMRPSAPTPPPARRPDFCDDAGVVTVFFEFDSTDLQPDATTILETLAQQAGICGWAGLSVVGHTDQAGSDGYNLALSQRRADVVATALRAKISAATKINVDSKGEANPRVPLADGTRSPENRRVEITAK